MKKLLISAAAVLFTATTALAEPSPRVTPADIGDLVTTHIGLSSGDFVEMNPIFAGGDVVPTAFLVKYLVRNYVPMGDVLTDAGSAFGLCNNVAVLSGGLPNAGIVVGYMCAVAAVSDLPPHEPETEEDCDRNERLVAGRVCM